ncbi:MAG: hypothetical protein LBV32_02120 [Tannerellaceae bacterium]|jgi:hypothetical protein|nr:hypothetical protein [Tannerellaceae bacterium]
MKQLVLHNATRSFLQESKQTVIALLSTVMILTLLPAKLAAGTNAPEGYPFLLGTAKGADNKPVPLMRYTLGTNLGAVALDGAVHNLPLAKTFTQFETKPDSDHPDGVAYIWVYDDAQNVYFVCDWTSDNTLDDGEDYFTVHVDDGAGVKSYTQHTDPVGGDYGVSVFGTTATTDYEHMWYAIAVPKADLSGNALKVGFELYGTASVNMSLEWAGTPPATVDAGSTVTFNARYSGESSTEDLIAFLVKCEDEDALAALSSYGYFEGGTFYTNSWENVAITGVEILDHNMFTVEPNEEVEGDVAFVQSLDAGTYILAVVAFHYYDESLYGYAWNASPIITATVTVESSPVPAPVTDITGVPESMTAGEPLEYEYSNIKVVPANATNKSMTWEITDVGTTGATVETGTKIEIISVDGVPTPVSKQIMTLHAPNAGEFVLTATIANGAAVGVPYTKDFTITVNGASGQEYGVVPGTFTGGSVVPDKTAYAENETVTLTITAEAGYVLEQISAFKTDDEATTVTLSGTGDTRTFTMPAYNVTVDASFTTQQLSDEAAIEAAIEDIVEGRNYYIFNQETANDAESIRLCLANTLNALLGESHDIRLRSSASIIGDITLNAIDRAVAGTENNPSGTDGSFTFTVLLTKGEMSIRTEEIPGVIIATPFTAEEYVFYIQTEAGTGGTIDPLGKVPVYRGAAEAFYFMPDEGYIVDKVVVDGKEVMEDNLRKDERGVLFYLFKGVVAHHTISVTFRLDPATGNAEVKEAAFRVWTADGQLFMSGLTPGESWSVYNMVGVKVAQGTATGSEATVALSAHGFYIVKVGRNMVKVMVSA